MYHLCTTATFPAIHHKRKILDIRLNIKDFPSVGVTGFEPATTRPQTFLKINKLLLYSNLQTRMLCGLHVGLHSYRNHD